MTFPLFPLACKPLEIPQAKLPEKEKFHLYLLIGQSNMVGLGIIEKTAVQPSPRILKLNAANQWVPAIEPIHSHGVGPGLSFAQVMAARDPSITIGLIPCAVGGTPLERWQKNGDLHQAAIARTQKAMKDGILKGVLWHQGESDATMKETAVTYATRLSEMIADLRKELGIAELPFVVGKIGSFVQQDGFPFVITVNNALADIPRQVPLTACVDANGLQDIGDHLHFNTEAQQELGKRYAREMIRLEN